MIPNNVQRSVLAGSGNRAVALLLDLMLAGFLLSGVVTADMNLIGPFVVPLFLLVYFSVMPLTRLQGTLGKWICRIKLCDRQGNRLGWRASLVRTLATFGWFAVPYVLDVILSNTAIRYRVAEVWWLLFLLPWVSIGFMPRQESLFDLLAGSLVVSYKATPKDITSVLPDQKSRVLNGIGMVLLCLFAGFVISTATSTMRAKNLYSRIAYAIGETQVLRMKIGQFHDEKKRWPDAVELGVSGWNPYPDGGGYRLQGDGTVVITFSVLPELKGHSITFVPKPAGNGQLDWQCHADAGIDRRYLPGRCR